MTAGFTDTPNVHSALIAPVPWQRRVTLCLRGQPWFLVILLPVSIIFLMGWVDYRTEWELSLFVFYAVPIILSVWLIGNLAGVAMCLLCSVVWWFANQNFHPYETQFGYAWAMLSRLIFYFVVVFSVTIVRKRQEEDAVRIQMLEERRQLERDIVTVSEHEQQRIGQDLHDGLCQQLAAIGCAARMLAEDLKMQGVAAACDAEHIEESVHQAVQEARSLARGIFPVHVDHSGLSAALKELAQNTSRLTSVEIEVRESVEVSLEDPGVSMHLYRIAQEAVANAVKHGSPQHILIDLRITRDELILTIEDDGLGVELNSKVFTQGMGLRTMRYRAESLGARLDVCRRLIGGTLVICRLPLQTPPTTNRNV
jgi:signal transduction histidine kinase